MKKKSSYTLYNVIINNNCRRNSTKSICIISNLKREMQTTQIIIIMLEYKFYFVCKLSNANDNNFSYVTAAV